MRAWKTFRSNRQELKSFIRIFEKHLRRSWFFLQLQARNLQLWKKRGNSQVFLVAPFAGSFTRLPLSSSFLPPKLLWNRLIPPPPKKKYLPPPLCLMPYPPINIEMFSKIFKFRKRDWFKQEQSNLRPPVLRLKNEKEKAMQTNKNF